MTQNTSFRVLVREGISGGGIVGPTVQQVYDIQADGNQAKVLQASLKEGSKTEYESLVGTASVQDFSGLYSDLKKHLQDLPAEGNGDFYGQGVSLSFFCDDFQWSNGGPDGCGGAENDKEATSEQKQKFREIVNSVKGLGQQFATNKHEGNIQDF